jgi:hypothetical protein
METNYIGIDYGMNTTNKNHSTGIRFGVINQNQVSQAWADSSELVYFYYCPNCGEEIGEEMPEDGECPKCKHEYKECDFYDIEPQGFILKDNEYVAHCGEDGDIFIEESPYYTYAQFCSPCAPGACSLDNPLKNEYHNQNNMAYCFGHDFFEDGKAPYTVYSVKTNEKVNP